MRVARREAVALRREKTIVLAILVQLVVAGFSSVLFVGLVGLYDPGSAASGPSIAVGVAGNASDELAAAVAAGDGQQPVVFGNGSEAATAFDRGEVDAVLLGNFNGSGVVFVRAIAPSSEFRTTVVVVQLRDALARLERQLRDRYASRLTRQPVAMPPGGEGSALYSLGYTVLLPLLVLLPAFIAGSIAVDSLAEEIERHTLSVLRVTPLTLQEIIDGKALTAIGSAPVQAVAWIGLLALNGTTIANPLPMLGVVTGYAVIAVALGVVVAALTNSRRDAQLLYSFGTLTVLAVASLTPTPPVNTIAKLGIGSPTTSTWTAVGTTLFLAIVAYWLARTTITVLIDTN